MYFRGTFDGLSWFRERFEAPVHVFHVSASQKTYFDMFRGDIAQTDNILPSSVGLEAIITESMNSLMSYSLGSEEGYFTNPVCVRIIYINVKIM